MSDIIKEARQAWGRVMTDRPIIFSAPMVRALLEGRKTQTRRVLKSQPDARAKFHGIERDGQALFTVGFLYSKLRIPYAPGDRLYVREAHKLIGRHCDYRADWPEATQHLFRWRPSIHMPRWASRLTLTVTDVRAQRLQDVSEADAMAEGCLDQVNTHCGPLVNCYGPACPTDPVRSCNRHGCWGVREDFQRLWNSLHGPDAWDANPWVVALTFTVERRNIDEVPQ